MKMMPLEEWRAGGELWTHQGLRIFTRSGGRGEALVLLHGFPTASWDWSPLWEPLARRFHLHALDFIGYGFSDKPVDHPYTITSQADLVEAWLAARGVSEYHILAHDYGDTVAQELLARHLERSAKLKLRSICFLNGGLFPEKHRPRFAQRLLLSPLGGWVANGITREKLGNSLNNILVHPLSAAEIDGFWTLLEHNNGRAVLPRLITYIPQRRANRDRWVGALENHTIPLRFINGADDPISGEHMLYHYRRLVPRADAILLRGIGHYPQVEEPAEALRHFLEFHDMLPSTLMHALGEPVRP